MKFTTSSGSQYEIEGDRVRRINPAAEKRADGEWVRLANHPHIEIGFAAVLTMESLAHMGQDDYGTNPLEASPYTTRITSNVTEIENA